MCNADGRPEEARLALSIFLLDKERYTLNGEVPCTIRLVPPSASQCYIYTKSDISMTFIYLTACSMKLFLQLLGSQIEDEESLTAALPYLS